jgi:hypothetical protein
MHHDPFARVRVAGVLSVLGIGLGCDEPSRVRPPLEWVAVFSVTSVTPNAGPSDTPVSLHRRNRVQARATVSLDGQATDVTVTSPVLITATAPIHAVGTVDVVVTNPDGESARLAGGYRYATLEVTRVQPDHALPGKVIRVIGIGFVSGATLTLGDVDVTVGDTYNESIVFIAPSHAAGPVDIVVTNPGGKTAMLAGGFRYDTVTLALTPTTVSTSGQLTMAWSGPRGGPFDGIGLFKVGTANEGFVWWLYTSGRASGTVTITAPAQPGDYELRYFVDDGPIVAARSAPVVVTPSEWTRYSIATSVSVLRADGAHGR